VTGTGWMQIGEGVAGEAENLAHVNTALGSRVGPVGTAWATALASPSAGHTPFVCVLQPGVAVQPLTLFVNKATIASDRHGELTWGAAQAGVAAGVADALADGTIAIADAVEAALIAAVWVNPAADEADAVFANNRAATHAALTAGATGAPSVDAVLEARAEPWNPYYRP
jgi:5,6,7,8-tetrahydromethanopterin hydro-lyase